jgi:hypothetical protein
MMERDIPDSSGFSGKIAPLPLDAVAKSQHIDTLDVNLRVLEGQGHILRASAALS